MNKVAALALAALAVVALVVVLMLCSSEEPEAPRVDLSAARIEPARVLAHPPPITAAPRATPLQLPGAQPTQPPAPTELDGQPVEELEPKDKGGQAPSGELTRRFDTIIAALPPESQPSNLNWNCADGGVDCSLTGLIVSNQALADLAEKLEGPNPSGGTDRPPTVEVHRIEETPDGKAFEIGVYIP